MEAVSRSVSVEHILRRLESVLPARRPVPLHEPTFDENSWVMVKDCLVSGWVSSAGNYVDRFEHGLEDYTGIPHAVATVNGTAALHTSLVLAGIEPNDEVLAPALTFVGTVNPIAAMGAIPHFVDVDELTLGVDPAALSAHLEEIAVVRHGRCFNKQSGRVIRALVVVHVLGHVAEMPRLREIAETYRLRLIEDAAEALGSFRGDRHAGHWGDLAILSFNGNKVITTGGGGAILTGDPALARRAKHLTTTAKVPHSWSLEHDEVAFNYRLPNINAALGVAQIEQLPDLLSAKRRLAEAYRHAFADLKGVNLADEPVGCRSNLWLNLLLLPDPHLRDALLDAAVEREILLRPFWTPLHLLPMYSTAPRTALPVTESLFNHGVCLPSSASLATVRRSQP